MKRSPLRKISKKQAEKNKLWKLITITKAINLGYICQWCGKKGRFDGSMNSLSGHHIIKRSQGRLDTDENCYVCHWLCHQFIDDNSIDVSKYPSEEVWRALHGEE